MELPNGTKRVTGFIIIVLGFVLPYFGYGLSEVAPVEMARFADALVVIVGMALNLYGEYQAKMPLWFAKVNRK